MGRIDIEEANKAFASRVEIKKADGADAPDIGRGNVEEANIGDIGRADIEKVDKVDAPDIGKANAKEVTEQMQVEHK